MTANIAPTPVQRFVDNNGNALVGGLLYTYAAGTTTPQATYTDSTGGTPNANPIVLNSRGECNLWLTPTLSYKFILKDALSNTEWTVDNVTGVASANIPSLLAASSGSSLVGFIYSFIGAVARTVQSKLMSMWVTSEDAGATVDGTTNDGAALRTTAAGFASTGGVLRFTRNTLRTDATGGSCVNLTAPLSLRGDGGSYSALNPSLAASTDDTIKITPNTGVDHTLSGINGLALHNPSNGTRTGRYGVFIDTQVANALVPLYSMRDTLVGQGSSWGVYHLNNAVNNIGGGMFCGLFHHNQIKGGLRLENSGDSMSVVHNILSGTGLGLYASLVSGSSLLEIQSNNITATNGAIHIDAGSRFRILGNNIEHSTAGAVANNDSAIVDITGAGGAIYGGVIKENLISGFGSTDATSGLKIDNCRGLLIQDNVFLSGVAGLPTGIVIGGSCQDVRVGANTFNAGITTQVTDNGVGTMGLVKTASLLNSWVAFAVGTSTLKYIKAIDGMVHLFGAIKSGTTTNGTNLALLPTGFRPAETIRAHGIFIAAGVPTPCEINVDSGGNVSINYVTSSTQLNINITFPASNLANGTSLE